MCSTYQQAFYNIHGVDLNNATQKQALDVFESHFQIAEKNLIYKPTRKVYEEILICLQKPSINVQKEHNIMKFICTCGFNQIKDTSIT